ncbi:MAG: CARDB domain-containing protein [Planctomycetota bacterium]
MSKGRVWILLALGITLVTPSVFSQVVVADVVSREITLLQFSVGLDPLEDAVGREITLLQYDASGTPTISDVAGRELTMLVTDSGAPLDAITDIASREVSILQSDASPVYAIAEVSSRELTVLHVVHGAAPILVEANSRELTITVENAIDFEEFAAGTVLTNQYQDRGVLFTTISGNPRIIADTTTGFTPVTGDRVFGDPQAGAQGVAEITFVVPNSSAPASTSSVLLYMIDAEQADGATITALDPGGRVVFEASYHAGDSSQELVTIEAPYIHRLRLNLGNDANTAAIDHLVFEEPTTLVQPDLAVLAGGIVVPAAGLTEEPFTPQVTIENIGSVAALGSWGIELYLSNDSDPQINAADHLLSVLQLVGPLAPGASATIAQQYALPENAGYYWLKAKIDSANELEEAYGELNNVAVSATAIEVDLAPRADLRIVSGSISGPRSAAVGGTIEVTYDFENIGDLDLVGTWTAQIYTSIDPVIGFDSPLTHVVHGDLPAGATASASVSVSVPDLSPGFYLIVCLDSSSVIQEHDEDNNCARSAATVDVVPCDLQTLEVLAPMRATADSDAILTYRVRNESEATASEIWVDRVFLSSDSILNLNGPSPDLHVASEVRLAPLTPHEEYIVTRAITIPGRIEGPYYFIVACDAFDMVAEAGDAANNIRSAANSTEIEQPSRPNLVVTDITTPDPGYTGLPVALAFSVTNTTSSPDGLGIAGGSWIDQVIATPAGGGIPTLLGQRLHVGVIPEGGSYTVQMTAPYPAEEGDYILSVHTDFTDLVNEGLEGGEDDNVVADDGSFAVEGFVVTVAADVDDAVTGVEPPLEVMLTGQALFENTFDGIPNAPVMLNIAVQGTQRQVSVTTDASGNYSVPFRPLANEAGLYELTAGPVGAIDPVVQDTFRLWGMAATPHLALGLCPGEEASLDLTLTNLGDLPLTGVTLQVAEAPPGVTVVASVPETLMGLETVSFQVTIDTAGTSLGMYPLTLAFGTNEGASALSALNLTLITPQPVLEASVASLTRSMLRGAQEIVEFELTNTGGGLATDLQIQVPVAAPWMSLMNEIPDLPPGASATVILQLTPSPDLDLVLYQGQIGVDALGSGISVGFNLPFAFLAVSDQQAELLVKVTDEASYYDDDANYFEAGRELAGALVRVFDPFTDELVAEGTTDGGLTFLSPFSLSEGYYTIRVNAPQHARFEETRLIQAGAPVVVDAFLPIASVSYEWTVEETEIEDTTIITLETTFETFVPYPVVTVDPPILDLASIQGDFAQIDFAITNSGFVTARDLFFSFGSHPGWQITPLVQNIGDLAADSTISVPVIVERTQSAGGGSSAASAGTCEITAGVQWRLFCVFWRYYWVPVVVLNAQGACGGVPGSAGPGGGGWVSGGPAGSSSGQPYVVTPTFAPPLECDPCDPNTFEPACYERDLGYLFGNAAGFLADLISTIPGLTATVELEAEGSVCTCCLDGGIGVSVEGQAAASIDGTIPVLGLNQVLSYTVNGHDVEVHLMFGCAVELGLNMQGSVSSGCLFDDPKVQVSASPSVGATCGVVVELEVDGEAVPGSQGLAISAGITGTLAYCSTTGWDGNLCFNGIRVHGVLSVPTPSGVVPYPIDKTLIDPICLYPQATPGMGAAAAALGTPSFAILLPPALVSYSMQPVAPASVASPVAGGSSAAAAPSVDATCAHVRLQLQQSVAITRSAFSATLEVTNDSDVDSVQDLFVGIDIFDASGNLVNTLFGIDDPVLWNLTAVDGTGELAPFAEASAQWLIVPTTDAAPQQETPYSVGGFFSYSLGGTSFSVVLEPAPITVRPDPRLVLHYFWQRDIVGDDPFTAPIEPSEPFSVGLLIENDGYGTARNVRVTSNQPQIVENEDGLLVSFMLIGTQVGEQPVNPSFLVNLGDIAPFEEAVARFLLVSSLQGQFLDDYTVGIEHLDDFGNARTSLFDDAQIHELIRVVLTNEPDDQVPDFLTNELAYPDDLLELDPLDVNQQYDPDRVDLPDTVRHSDGSVSEVTAVLSASVTVLPPTPEAQFRLRKGGSGALLSHGQPFPSAPSGATVAHAPGLSQPAPAEVASTAPERSSSDRVVLEQVEVEVVAALGVGWSYVKVPSPLPPEYRLVRAERDDGTSLPDYNAWITTRVFQEGHGPPLDELRLHIFDRGGTGVYRLTFER